MTTATTAQAETTAVLTAPSIDDAMKSVTVAQETAASLRVAFAPHYQELHQLAEQARSVKADEPKKARALRLAMKAVRVAANNTREERKADSLRLGKAIQGIYNVLEYQCIPMEEALERIEKAEEIREANRKAALQEARAAELREFMDVQYMALGEMSEEAYANLLAGAKAALKATLEAQAKVKADAAERERLAAEERAEKAEIERVERERLKAENERLAKVAAEETRKRQEQEDAAKKQRDEAEAKAAQERKAAKEKQDAADRAAAEERQKLAAAAEAEKRKREIAEAETKRLEQEKADKAKAAAAAARKAARAPEQAKVFALAKQVRAIVVPELKSEEGAAVATKIKEQVAKFATWLEVEGGKL